MKKIKPKYIEYLVNKLSENKEKLQDELLKPLGRYTVSLADITSQRNRMGFDVSRRSAGKIVALLLRDDGK